MKVMHRFLPLTLTLMALGGCTKSTSPERPAPTLEGLWHAELKSPGGPLPFGLQIRKEQGWALNGKERAPLSGVERRGEKVVLSFAGYDAQIDAQLTSQGTHLEGTWTKRGSNRQIRLPFSARRGAAPRFESQPASGDASGIWKVEFKDDSGTQAARARFTQSEDGIVTGTFLTPTGDYRFLEGVLDGSTLRLSCFDGAHAFLFVAKLNDSRLTGDFWSSDRYHATWTGERVARAEQAPLPDPYGLATLTNKDRKLNFAFEDLDAKMVRASDPRFEGKVLLVDIFGTWCPNCNDQAPYLVKWHQQYRDQGLEVVGLAYEISGDQTRDREMLRRYRQRHGITFPLLLGGVSDKKKAGETLPDLSAVVAYPTTVFVGRDGTVRAVHTGFAGPGTGAEHTELIRSMQARIEGLLSEQPAQGADRPRPSNSVVDGDVR